MIDCTNVVYAKNKTELPWLIGSGPICDKNGIRQQCDKSHRFGLHQNQNWTIGTYLTKYDLLWKPNRTKTLSIMHMCCTPKTILNYLDRSDQVQFFMKPKEDNNVTDLTGAIYAENDTEVQFRFWRRVNMHNRSCRCLVSSSS